MRKIEVGDNVWCWDPACSPKEAVVTELNACGMNDVYRCYLVSDRVAPDRIWTDHRVFLRPQEANKLYCEMMDHAHFLEQQAKEIAAQEIAECDL